MTHKKFDGQVAIITGSARGMGKATALHLAREGASVVAVDIRQNLIEETVREIEEEGGAAMGCVVDISDPNQVATMVSDVLNRFNTIHILVNNAGIMKRTSPAESIPLDEWKTMFDINATGTFLCIKHVLPVFKEQKRGKIVNVSSSAGRSMSTFCGAHYSASKAAILGLTRHIANESASYNININAIAPGSFKTEGGYELLAGAPPELIDQEELKIPLRRFGTSEDVARLVAFLCSEEASYITGATIDINGGDLMM